jgi:hypothetical protein
MRLHGCLVFGLLILALVAPAAQQEKPAEKKVAPRALKLKLNYTGSGQVDSKHRIIVFLFDSSDFVQGGDTMPFASMSASAKDETVAFSDVAQSPVYVVAAYDPAGSYDGQSGPQPVTVKRAAVSGGSDNSVHGDSSAKDRSRYRWHARHRTSHQ